EQQIYLDGGWGGRVGFGQRPALVVVDMYTAFVDMAYPFASPGARDTARVIGRLLDAARASGTPVFYTRGEGATWPIEGGRWTPPGVSRPIMDRPEASQIVPELAPRSDEPVIVKAYPSGFQGTNLLAYLVYHNIDTLIVTGTVTSGCVRDTVLDAFNYNYRIVVPVEPVRDRGSTPHKAARFATHIRHRP